MNSSKIISILIICTMFFSFTETFGKDAAKLRIVKTIHITSDGEYYQNPKLSPDGNMVVFRGRNGGLFIRNTDGTGPMVSFISWQGNS
ncbi:MAG: hypothetical protein GWP19_06220 [Planctomycetia bacterium]|nr:hypothetical protein [Planctomycetia bacterium]